MRRKITLIAITMLAVGSLFYAFSRKSGLVAKTPRTSSIVTSTPVPFESERRFQEPEPGEAAPTPLPPDNEPPPEPVVGNILEVAPTPGPDLNLPAPTPV